METDTASRNCPRPEWARRFAYRVMLLRHEMDTTSAVMLGDSAFDAASDLEPEDAAERYANGRGVAKDEAEAVRWYRKAAERGHKDAQAALTRRGLTWTPAS